LIEIPYWWNQKKESIVGTIAKYRAELVKGEEMSEPVPDKDPHLDILAPKKPADVYNFLLTPLSWQDDMDPTSWWLTEQIQGVWAYWTGKMLVSRRAGKPIARCPSWMYAGMPAFPMEVYLWLDNTSTFVLKKDEETWKRVLMFVLDAPTQNMLFEARLEKIKQQTFPSHVRILDPVKCRGPDHLKEFLNLVLTKGGQGVLIRQPQSKYEEGSLYHIRKYEDTEVLYLGVNEKSHRLICQLPSGEQLMVSAPHQVVVKPPPMNTVVTIRYQNRNSSIHSPCFLKYSDISWTDVQNSASSKKNLSVAEEEE